MDSSRIAALGSPKPPTIASRRPMLSSQRSFSVLSINTNTTHGDLMRRNSSATTANRHRRLQTPTVVPPLPLSANTGGNMSLEELSSKIADSFQQFSSMLSQLSSNKPPANTITTPVIPPLMNPVPHPTSKPTNINPQQPVYNNVSSPKLLSSPPLSSSNIAAVTVAATQNNHRKDVRVSSSCSYHLTTSEVQKTPSSKFANLPQLKKVVDSESESEEETNDDEYNSHAIYFENALDTTAINEGNTRLRRGLISKWLTCAASIGDLKTMQQMLNSVEDIDINCTDDKRSGITCLMYASYFGHVQCLNLLLKHPSIRINQQDKKGWTALMWAINSFQIEIVQILLNHGAEKSLETRYGRTVFNYPTSLTVKELLGTPPSAKPIATEEKNLSTSSSNGSNDNKSVTNTVDKENDRRASSNSMNSEIDYYYQNGVDGYSHFLKNHGSTNATDLRRKSAPMTPTKSLSPPDFSQLSKATTTPQQEQKIKENSNVVALPANNSNSIEEEEDMKRWEASIKSSNTFSWNQCLPDQMFVFSQDDIHFIVDQALNVTDTKSLMNKSQLSNELWQPANIIFLGTRFAHYCSSRDLLTLFLNTVATKLTKIIKAASRDIQSLAYWIANICQLSSYLKKDPGLSVSTYDAQETLSELISEAYSYFVTESQKKIEKILEPSMMEYESIHELEQVDFVDDWQRFFRRSSSNHSRKSIETISSLERKSSVDSTATAATTSSNSIESSSSTISSPQSITNSLTQIQSTLQAYHVPPAIVIQAVAQFFHYLSCELFNRVLTYKKYLCRSKALQIRMNLSAIEEWVRTNQLPSSLNNAFEPLVQLLQLLQCLSQMDDIILFSSTVQTFDKLNPLQVKRCVQNYRYEVSESKLPDEVEQLASQMALDHRQQRSNSRRNSVIQTRASTDSIANNISGESPRGGGRPASISSLNCLLTTTTNKKRLSSEEIMSINNSMVQQLDDEEEHDEMEGEKRNSKYLLPFSIPVTTALLQGWTEEKHKKSIISSTTSTNNYSEAIYQGIKLKKQEQYNLLDKTYPTIPEEWLYHLDKRLHVR